MGIRAGPPAAKRLSFPVPSSSSGGAWAGDAAAVLLIAIRTYRLIFHPEEMEDGAYRIKPVE